MNAPRVAVDVANQGSLLKLATTRHRSQITWNNESSSENESSTNKHVLTTGNGKEYVSEAEQ